MLFHFGVRHANVQKTRHLDIQMPRCHPGIQTSGLHSVRQQEQFWDSLELIMTALGKKNPDNFSTDQKQFKEVIAHCNEGRNRTAVYTGAFLKVFVFKTRSI